MSNISGRTNVRAFLRHGIQLVFAICLCNHSSAQNPAGGGKSPATKTSEGKSGLQIHIWHGLHQKVGHLGCAQADFNLMGHVAGHEDLDTLTYAVNGASPEGLNVGYGNFGDNRRLAAAGDFNADIPTSRLRAGRNEIVVTARNVNGRRTSVKAYVEKLTGSYPLPANIDWDHVANPQDVGQLVDGMWAVDDGRLRTLRTGYDRVFLVGDTSWQDY